MRRILNKALRTFRKLSVLASNIVDRYLYSKRLLALVSLGITLLIFVSVIYSESLANQIMQSTELVAKVEVVGDLDEYEISDIPETVNVVITGSSIDVRTAQNTGNYSAVLDISNLSEGNHRVRLERKGFSSALKVIFQPEYLEVNISRKSSQVFDVSPNYINEAKLEPQYNLSNPILEVNEVTINTSLDKLNQISQVSALIDVANKTESFTVMAKVVAYDQSGNAMDVDIEPSEISASVSISSPNKQVNVEVTPIGAIPNEMAIESIVIDYPSITLYGPEEVLDLISNIPVSIDAALLKNTETQLKHTLVRPEGVRSMDVETVNLTITLASKVEREIEKSQIFFENNVNNYEVVTADGSDLVVDVILSGTQTHVDNVNASLIRVSLDMSNLRPGKHTVNLTVVGPDRLVNYELQNQQIEVEISEKGE